MAVVRPDVDGFFQKLLVGPIRQFYGMVALGNMTQWPVAMMRLRDGILVAVPNRHCGVYNRPIRQEEMCNTENLPLTDQRNLADFINDQFDGERAERQGFYMRGLCRKNTGEEDEQDCV